MSRKRKRGDEGLSSSWMDTYADTITLLLTFFILLYTFSIVDNERLKSISDALKGQMEGTPTTNQKVEELPDDFVPGIGVKNPYDELVEKVTSILEKNGLSDDVKIREEDAGVILQLGDSILFDTGQAELKAGSYKILDVIGSIIPQIDNEIMVQGHTDNRPINSPKYPSNWELSSDRALAVVKYFINEKGISAKRFSGTGYGEHRPLVENNSAENMGINRRVDILIVQQKETGK